MKKQEIVRELNKVSRDIRAGKVAAKMIGGEIKFVKAA